MYTNFRPVVPNLQQVSWEPGVSVGAEGIATEPQGLQCCGFLGGFL